MGFLERRSGETGGDDADEVGALQDVFVGTVQGVFDGVARGLSFGDVRLEFGELALGQLPPAVPGKTRCDERFQLAQRESDISQQQDDTDVLNR